MVQATVAAPVAPVTPPPPPAKWIGWERVDAKGKRAPWEARCWAWNMGDAWRALLRLPAPPGACERTVLEEGRRP